MRITEQTITTDNVFEQMALMTKKKLVEQGILPSDADKIAIEFVKERGEQVIKNLVKKRQVMTAEQQGEKLIDEEVAY